MHHQIICSTCGTYYPLNGHPEICTICSDDRQYIPEGGQRWTLPAELHQRHSIRLNKIKDRLYELEVNPQFAIGQRALLVLSDEGNVLWDCIPMLDEMTVAFINSKGGLKAIAFSHPHYYSNMNDWASTFNCPTYINEQDAEHIMVNGPHIKLWKGQELALWDGLTLHCIGGHFEGSSIMRVPFVSAEGALLCGDSLFLSPSKKHISISRSYPNRIPIALAELKRIQQQMRSITFDEFYGYIKTQNLQGGARLVFEESMSWYV